MKGLTFIIMLVIAAVLLQAGYDFYGIIAAILAVLSLVAESEGRPRMPAGGPVKRTEAKDRPPHTYQLAQAGGAVAAVFRAIWKVISWFFSLGRKKKP